MIIYALSSLVKAFGSRTVLDIDALNIEKGYIYALLGPNGSGKTTLLNILGFLDRPTSGEMRYLNNPVTYTERYLQRLRRQVVMVNQNPILFTTTVFKNLEFGLKIRQISPKKRQRIIEESLDLVGMRHLMAEPAQKLSGGETQRIVLARALALSPEVILCDEPTANVDPENQTAIANLLKDINAEKGITLVFTSHDKAQAAFLPHHTFYLEKGRINDLSYENMFSARFIAENHQLSRCIVQERLNLWLPLSRTGMARIRIDPESVLISASTTASEEQMSHSGIIMQISVQQDQIRIIVDCGIPITVLLSETEYRRQRLMVSDMVNLTIPPPAVRIL